MHSLYRDIPLITGAECASFSSRIWQNTLMSRKLEHRPNMAARGNRCTWEGGGEAELSGRCTWVAGWEKCFFDIIIMKGILLDLDTWIVPGQIPTGEPVVGPCRQTS